MDPDHRLHDNALLAELEALEELLRNPEEREPQPKPRAGFNVTEPLASGRSPRGMAPPVRDVIARSRNSVTPLQKGVFRLRDGVSRLRDAVTSSRAYEIVIAPTKMA